MKKTQDDWYPCFANNEVRVSIFKLEGPHGYCITAQGNDDYGLDINIKTLKLTMEMYNKIKTMDFVNQQDLYDLGFEFW